MILMLGFSACKTTALPTGLSGTFTQSVPVTVREGHFGDFEFIRSTSPVTMQLVIAENGTVTGNIGGATLAMATCATNRGDLGRALNIKTDYIIQGTLTGNIFPGDNYSEKQISIPFNIDSTVLRGSIFHTFNNGGLFPIADLSVVRTE